MSDKISRGPLSGMTALCVHVHLSEHTIFVCSDVTGYGVSQDLMNAGILGTCM